MSFKSSIRAWLPRVLVVGFFLGPACYGFSGKMIEFVKVFRGETEGAFAISPLLNYLLASLGFLFMFGWAAANGMFHDIEQPKNTMLEHEDLLDHGQLPHPTHG
jgi:hypothetical protein